MAEKGRPDAGQLHLPGAPFKLEDGQRGREAGQHGERGQPEAVAERPARIVQERQRNEHGKRQYFQPRDHGTCGGGAGTRSATFRAQQPAVPGKTTAKERAQDRTGCSDDSTMLSAPP